MAAAVIPGCHTILAGVYGFVVVLEVVVAGHRLGNYNADLSTAVALCPNYFAHACVLLPWWALADRCSNSWAMASTSAAATSHRAIWRRAIMPPPPLA